MENKRVDYGKLAYLRLDDMEARLVKSNAKTITRCSGAVFSPKFEISNEKEAQICSIFALGASALSVKLVAQVFSIGSADILINGIKAGEAQFFMNGHNSAVAFCPLQLEQKAILSIKSRGELVAELLSVEVLMYGENAVVERSFSGFRFDGDDSAGYFALMPIDGIINYATATTALDVLSAERKRLSVGFKSDVVKTSDGFKVVLLDNYDNLFGISFSSVLDGFKETERRLLGVFEGSKSVAITVYNNKLVIMLLIEGRLNCFLTDHSFKGATLIQRIEMPFKVTEVSFVKSSDKPLLLAYSEEKSFLKMLEDEQSTDGTVSVTVLLTTGGVNV